MSCCVEELWSGAAAGKGKQLVICSCVPGEPDWAMSMPRRQPVAGVGKAEVLCLIMRITTRASISTSRMGGAGGVGSAMIAVGF